MVTSAHRLYYCTHIYIYVCIWDRLLNIHRLDLSVPPKNRIYIIFCILPQTVVRFMAVCLGARLINCEHTHNNNNNVYVPI